MEGRRSTAHDTPRRPCLRPRTSRAERFAVERRPRARRSRRDETAAAGPRGVDLRNRREDHPQRPPQAGRRAAIVLGHEFIGTIEARRSGRGGLRWGQRVGVVPERRLRTLRCLHSRPGELLPRVHGLRHRSRRGTRRLVEFRGGSSPRATSCRCRKACPTARPRCWSRSPAWSTACGACGSSWATPVAIFGAGPIGLMHVMLCRIAGAGGCLSSIRWRTGSAARQSWDATVAIDPAPGRRAASGSATRPKAAARTCDHGLPGARGPVPGRRALAPYGRLCLFGACPAAAPPCRWTPTPSITATFSSRARRAARPADYRIALRLMAGKRIDLTAVISRRLLLWRTGSRLPNGAGRADRQSRACWRSGTMNPSSSRH